MIGPKPTKLEETGKNQDCTNQHQSILDIDQQPIEWSGALWLLGNCFKKAET